MWRPVGRKTRVGTLTEDNCASGEIIANFLDGGFSEVIGIQTLGSERMDVEALKKYPCPAACASLWRQPNLFGDDTHAVGHTAKVGTRARTAQLVWFLMSVGCEPGPSTSARNEDVGRSERKTPSPRATYRQRKSNVSCWEKPGRSR